MCDEKITLGFWINSLRWRLNWCYWTPDPTIICPEAVGYSFWVSYAHLFPGNSIIALRFFVLNMATFFVLTMATLFVLNMARFFKLLKAKALFLTLSCLKHFFKPNSNSC